MKVNAAFRRLAWWKIVTCQGRRVSRVTGPSEADTLCGVGEDPRSEKKLPES